jgi:hypothetical protein
MSRKKGKRKSGEQKSLKLIFAAAILNLLTEVIHLARELTEWLTKQ